MGIGGYILAGALQGAGNAITQQAVSEQESRRQIALENLKAANLRESTLFKARVDDASDASKQKRTNDYAISLATTRGEVQKAVDNNRGEIQGRNDAASDARDRETRVMVEGLQHKYRMSEQEAGDVRKFLQENSQVTEVKVLASGQIVGLTKGGGTIAYKGTAANGKTLFLRTAKPGEKGDDDGATVGASIGARTGQPSATPSPTPSATPAPAGGIRNPTIAAGIGARSRTGTPSGGAAVAPVRQNDMVTAEEGAAMVDQFSGFLPGTTASAAVGQTYTVAQLREFAEKTGMSDTEARAWARERGFTITR